MFFHRLRKADEEKDVMGDEMVVERGESEERLLLFARKKDLFVR